MRSFKARRIRIDALQQMTSSTLIGAGDVFLDGAAEPSSAGPSHLTYCHHPKRMSELRTTEAGCIVMSMEHAALYADRYTSPILCADSAPDLWRRSLDVLFVDCEESTGGADQVHETAIVDPSAVLDSNVKVGPYAVVGAHTSIGQGTVVGSHAVIGESVRIGAECRIGPHCVLVANIVVGEGSILQPGVVVGADGFGYAPHGKRNLKVRQVGTVIIGNDVEIGALSAVDRGQLRPTIVGTGTKIDNHVQVGHGVQMGENVVVVAGGGIGGDVDIGDGAVLAGQVGVAPYVRIGDQSRIGAKSGVTRDVGPRTAVSGIPAYPHRDWLKASARLPHLDAMYRKLRVPGDER